MIRTSSTRRPASRKGYTLLEVLLALGLSGMLMILVYGAMQTYWSLSSTGKVDAERCQMARALVRRMEMDIRSITYKPAEQQVAESEGQAADEGVSAAEEGGVSAAEDTSAPTVSEPAPVEITEDDTYLVAEVHLIGTSQSLEMIVLRPTRNRTGSMDDAVFAATDIIAISSMRALAASGYSIPSDVAVVGYDDIAMAAHVHPSLTTVRQDLARGANLLVDLLLRRIAAEETESVMLPAELVVRESSGGAS